MMQHPDYNSPVELKEFLEARGMCMQKKFGQNFLVNGDARRKIVDALEMGENATVWEVGPGLGSMTDELLRRGAKVTAFEIDHGFARLVREFFEDYTKNDKFDLVEGDVLKTWTKYSKENGQAQYFFGNLPYNVAATIIADTINEGIRFDKMVVTIQKEVGLRMAALPGTENYSSFSVLCQWAYNVKSVMDLAGGSFWPVPNVASRAMVMTKREDFPRCKNPSKFMKMIRELFASRRKTIRNNLVKFCGAENADKALEAAGISPSERAENLNVDKLLILCDALEG